MNSFPIYTKTESSYQMMISPYEVLNVVHSEDMLSEIKHVKYETMVTNAFEEYCSGESKVITRGEFLDAYSATLVDLRSVIFLSQPIEMDHTSILTSKIESENEIK